MRTIGNLLWFFFGGLLLSLSWAVAGALWCVTIIGIPWGVQCFKFAGLLLWPFGKQVTHGGGAVSLLANLVWLLLSGAILALEAFALGCLWCLTIVGIPWGEQFFKYAKLALMPFGARVD